MLSPGSVQGGHKVFTEGRHVVHVRRSLGQELVSDVEAVALEPEVVGSELGNMCRIRSA